MKAMVMMLVLVLACGVFAQEATAVAVPQVSEDPLVLVGKEIDLVRAQIVQCDKDNPHVYFNESDNPTMNIRRGLREVRVNREYYCPYHRGHKYCNGVCGWTDMVWRQRQMTRRELAGCPAVSNNINGYPVWLAYAEQVPLTLAKDKERAELQVKLQELLERKASIALAKDVSDKGARLRDPDAETSDMIVISIPRKKVFELYSNRVTCHNGYKIVVQP